MISLKSISMSKKLFFAYLLFALPVVYLLSSLIKQQQIAIDFGTKELEGSAFLADIQKFHLTLLKGDLKNQIEINKKYSFSDSDLIKEAIENTNKVVKAGDKFAALENLRSLTTHVGDLSNLILDPDLDSFYLMDAVIIKFPSLADRMAKLIEIIKANPEDKQEIVRIFKNVQDDWNALEASIKSSYRGNADGSVEKALNESFSNLGAKMKAIWALGDAGKFLEITEESYSSALDILFGSAFATRGELDRLLALRIAGFQNQRFTSLVITAILFLTAVTLAIFMLRYGMLKPIKTLTVAMNKLAENDISEDIKMLDRGDEIGGMARAVLLIKQKAEDKLRREEEDRSRIMKREKGFAGVDRLTRDFGDSILGIVQNVSKSSVLLKKISADVSKAIDDSVQSSNGAASAVHEGVGDLEAIAAAAEELATGGNQIEDHVKYSLDKAGRAVTESHKVSEIVEGLNEITTKIGSVVGLINDIAGQTNLLALNATIEAARAGEAGKGFAVVASEVKSLANQTSSATDEIAKEVQAVQQIANEIANAIQKMGGTIQETEDAANAISSTIGQQNGATREIASRVHQVAGATQSITSHIDSALARVESAHKYADQLSEDSKRVEEEAATLRKEIEDFLTSLREVQAKELFEYRSVDWPAEIHVGQQSSSVRLEEISLGGASVTPVIAADSGMPIDIVINKVKIAARIAHSSNNNTRIRFDLSQSSRAQIQGLFNNTKLNVL